MQLSLWIAFFVVSNLLGIEVFKAAVTLPWEEALLPGVLTVPLVGAVRAQCDSHPGRLGSSAKSSFYNRARRSALESWHRACSLRPSVWSNQLHVHP